jgi:hypothetical protein
MKQVLQNSSNLHEFLDGLAYNQNDSNHMFWGVDDLLTFASEKIV